MFNLGKCLEKIDKNDIKNLNFRFDKVIDVLKPPKETTFHFDMGNEFNYEICIVGISSSHFAVARGLKIYILNAQDKVCERVIDTESPITALLALENGDLLSSHLDFTVRKWNPITGKSLGILLTEANSILCMKLVNDKYIITGCDSSYNYIRKWDVKTGRLISATMSKKLVAINMMETYINQYLVSYSSHDKKIREWDILNWKFIREIEAENEIYSMCIDPYGYIICGEQPQGVIRTREPSGNIIRTYKIFSRYDTTSLLVLPDGNFISMGDHHTFCLFESDSGKILQVFLTSHYIEKIAMLCDGKIVGINGEGETVIWEFPKKSLDTTNLYLVMHHLLSNKSVTKIDLSNVVIIEEDLFFLEELYKKRPDLIITGLSNHVTDTLTGS